MTSGGVYIRLNKSKNNSSRKGRMKQIFSNSSLSRPGQRGWFPLVFPDSGTCVFTDLLCVVECVLKGPEEHKQQQRPFPDKSPHFQEGHLTLTPGSPQGGGGEEGGGSLDLQRCFKKSLSVSRWRFLSRLGSVCPS